jgi:hypothetical protein
MTCEPQVTSTTATQNSTERVLTRRQADLLPAYGVVGRWFHRAPAFLHENEPEHHLEELALMAVWAVADSLAADQHAPGDPRGSHAGTGGRGSRNEPARRNREVGALGGRSTALPYHRPSRRDGGRLNDRPRLLHSGGTAAGLRHHRSHAPAGDPSPAQCRRSASAGSAPPGEPATAVGTRWQWPGLASGHGVLAVDHRRE